MLLLADANKLIDFSYISKLSTNILLLARAHKIIDFAYIDSRGFCSPCKIIEFDLIGKFPTL